MIDVHKERVKAKLALWETPGFLQFIEDLAQQMGPEIGVHIQVNSLKNVYIAKLKQMEKKTKFKQTKLF